MLKIRERDCSKKILEANFREVESRRETDLLKKKGLSFGRRKKYPEAKFLKCLGVV